jgi:phosphoglycolate phosphatase
MTNKQLIIFDWDGTLMDTVPKIVNTVKLVADCHQLTRPTDDAIRQIIGLSLDVAINELFEKPSMTLTLSQSYKDIYVNEETPSTLFPHVRECLTALHEKGYTLAVATGKSRKGLNRLMAETELAHLFEATRTACECASKPSPEMILEICDELNIASDKTVMVGDTTMDLAMANNAKVASVGVSFGAHPVSQLKPLKPITIIDQFEQLIDLF